jgi:hypothetical protein
MRDNEPNKRIQALTPNKKQTATMKRRALKPINGRILGQVPGLNTIAPLNANRD